MTRRAAGPAFSGALALLALLTTSLCGCQREAPGPEECVLFARVSYGVSGRGRVEPPSLRAKIDELTRECLLTPYDRELLACTLEGGSPRACMQAFSMRHRLSASAHRER